MRPLVPQAGIAASLSSLLRRPPALAAAAVNDASGAAAQAMTAIGSENFGPYPALSRTIAGCKEEMAKQGYVDRKNAAYVHGEANFTPGLIPQTLAQTVAILVVTTPVARASARNVSDRSVPLVFTRVSNPVAAGLMPDWAHGGGRIIGMASVTDYDAVLAFAKQGFSKSTYFGFLNN